MLLIQMQAMVSFINSLLLKLGQFKSILTTKKRVPDTSTETLNLCASSFVFFSSTNARQLTIQDKQILGCHSIWQPSNYLSHRQPVMPVRWWDAKTVDGVTDLLTRTPCLSGRLKITAYILQLQIKSDKLKCCFFNVVKFDLSSSFLSPVS